MQYRQLDVNGDYVVGQPFLANSPACVSQAISTRLKLWLGEWFVDTSDGTPIRTQVLGKNTGTLYDAAIKQRILGTPGVIGIAAYSSQFDGPTRTLSVTASVLTQYASTPTVVTVDYEPPVQSGLLTESGQAIDTESGTGIDTE